MRISPPDTDLTAALLSGAMLGISTTFMVSWLAWISFVPLLWGMSDSKRILLCALAAGIAYGVVLESWVFNAVAAYTGNNRPIALLCHGTAVSIMALRVIVIATIFGLFKKLSRIGLLLIWPLFATAADMMMYRLLEGFPWFQYTIGFTQVRNLCFIQWAETGDVHLLTWLVLTINLLFLILLKKRNILNFILLSGVILAIHGYGFVRVARIESRPHLIKKVAVLNDNSTTALRWSPKRVNEYADRILTLAGRIEEKGQILNIWNEGLMPWTYRRDDDLTNALLEVTGKKSPSPSLIGISSKEGKAFYNSAYLIESNGSVAGRYDKQNLLRGIEIPSLGFKMPFFEESPFNTPPETRRKPVHTDHADIGVLICNEGITGKVASSYKSSACDFIILIANDNWFTGTPLIRHHFYFIRLRAVQNRMDLVINSNLGISGHVSASGKIVQAVQSEKPLIEYYDVKIHKEDA